MRVSRRLVLAAAVFGLLLAPIAWAVLAEVEARKAAEILRPIHNAEETISIRGDRRVISYQDGTVLESIQRVFLKPPEGRKVLFMEYRVNGEPTDPKKWSNRFFKGAKKEKEPKKKKEGLFDRIAKLAGWDLPQLGKYLFSGKPERFHDIELLARNYDVSIREGEVVAGHKTDLVDIRARYPGRSSYRLWVERKLHYALRFQVLSADEKPLFESVYDKIAFNPEFPKGVFKTQGSPTGNIFLKMLGIEWENTTIDRAAGTLGFPVWKPSELPGGVRVEDCMVVRANLPAGWLGGEGGGKIPIEILHATYTDGAAVAALIELSLTNPFWLWLKPMLEEEHPPEATAGKQRVYRVAHHGGTLFITEKDETVIAVAGNLPEAELLNMVRSLRRVK